MLLAAVGCLAVQRLHFRKFTIMQPVYITGDTVYQVPYQVTRRRAHAFLYGTWYIGYLYSISLQYSINEYSMTTRTVLYCRNPMYVLYTLSTVLWVRMSVTPSRRSFLFCL